MHRRGSRPLNSYRHPASRSYTLLLRSTMLAVSVAALCNVNALCALTVDAIPATLIDCSTSGPSTPNITIDAAGSYNVTCTVNPGSSWFLHIVGCKSSTGGVVNITLLSSPTQVIVSDNTSLVGLQSASLTDCSVSITYAANTTVPDGTNRLQAHVLVATASPLQALSVTLLATLYIQGAFVAVAGNGSGTLGHVLVAAPPSSSIVCYRAANDMCGLAAGTSLVRLDPGCPVILKVSISLNGTTTSQSMASTPQTSFGLLYLDSHVAAPPIQNDIVVDSVNIVVGNYWIAIRTVFGNYQAYNAYPSFNGTVVIRNCALTSLQGYKVFQFENPLALVILLDHVNCDANLLNLLNLAQQQSSLVRYVQVRILHSNIVTTSNSFLTLSKTINVSTFAPRIECHNTTFTVDGNALLLEVYLRSQLPTDPPSAMMFDLIMTLCTIHLLSSRPQLIGLSKASSVNSSTGPLPLITNSSIIFEHVTLHQQWSPYIEIGNAIGFPPVAVVDLSDVVDSTIVFLSCNVTIQQDAASTSGSQTPVLLLDQSGSMTRSFIAMIDSTFTLVQNSSVVPLQAPLLDISSASGTIIVVKRSAFTNIGAVVRIRSTAPTITVDCGTSWCLQAPEPSAVATCSQPVTRQALIGTSTATTVNICSSTTASNTVALPSLSMTPTLPTGPPPSSTSSESGSTVIALQHVPATVGTIATAGSVVVYAALATGSGAAALARGAVPALQRAIASQRLAAQCNDDSPVDAQTFDSFGDNPLGLCLGVGAPCAAGAAVGDVVILVVVGVASHCIGVAQKSFAGSGTPTAKAVEGVADLLPSSLLPGALALPLASLLQPSVAACVTLLSDSSPAAVVLGAVLLLVWTVVVAYLGWEVLWHARQQRWMADGDTEFLLRTLPVRQQADPRGHHCAHPVLHSAVSLAQPSEKWVSCFDRDAPAAATKHVHYVAAHLEALFGPYVGKREWFFLVEWGLSTAMGACLGGANAIVANQNDACSAAKLAAWSAVVIGVAQLALYAWLRPHRVRLELHVAAAVGALCVVSEVLTLTNELEAAAIVTLAATVVQLSAVSLLVLLNLFATGANRRRVLDTVMDTDNVELTIAAPVHRLYYCGNKHLKLRQLGELVQLICAKQPTRPYRPA